MSGALTVTGLGYAYRSGFALEEVAFTAGAGAFTVLLGPNGAGKSTLVNLVTRLYSPGAGGVFIGGHSLADEPGKALARLGVVFQQSTLDLDLSTERNLRYGAALHGLWGKAADRSVEDGLARFGLEAARKQPARSLSGGNRRKLELARALAHKPAVLVCDEATVGLDTPSRRALLAHLRRLCREEGLAVLWTTHLMDEVEEADPVVLLKSGRVRAAGSAGELIRRAGADGLESAFQALLAEEGA
ncbi:ATP-binding cassette domain-containing protein [Magnetospirillum sp. 15-1]|uniref:ATP-binding cassette domain-containing protein n=1 Tax=Magnetospirillum sp. 15-1 TaxID=1979370 RepID=UPI000BBCA86F|nr:ATP-binding cassette domain-containing protein [Magnetospirillum sp. 15-1]